MPPTRGRRPYYKLGGFWVPYSSFGETFPIAPELEYEYVVATIDVKEQKLKLVHNNVQVDEIDCKLQ